MRLWLKHMDVHNTVLLTYMKQRKFKKIFSFEFEFSLRFDSQRNCVFLAVCVKSFFRFFINRLFFLRCGI